jgi:hypothetical protein
MRYLESKQDKWMERKDISLTHKNATVTYHECIYLIIIYVDGIYWPNLYCQFFHHFGLLEKKLVLVIECSLVLMVIIVTELVSSYRINFILIFFSSTSSITNAN